MKQFWQMLKEWWNEDWTGTKVTSKEEQARQELLRPFIRRGGSNLWGVREEW